MRVSIILVGLAASVACAAPDDGRQGWFPFVIPDLADEQTAGTPIDLSFLNAEPAGTHGHLRPDGERIVDGRGREVRLFGSNICDHHPMPPKAQAPRMARRLRELGINFIRLHYFDFAKAPAGILNADMQTLNPEKLDQFDWLIAQLKENGIYVDINLHVCRPYPGQPKEVHRFGKGIDFIYEPYIASQQQYARELIGHVNPYTGLSYAKDPVVAVIELNNENTVFQLAYALAGLPEPFRGAVTRKWNAWLAKTYGGSEAVRAAWNASAQAEKGPELLKNGRFQHNTREWSFQSAGGAKAAASVVDDAASGAPAMRWEVASGGSDTWHVQAMVPGLPVEHGKTYAISFRARAQGGTAMKLGVGLMMQKAPWTSARGGATIALDGTWREYGVTCAVENPEAVPMRLNFAAGRQAGVIELSGVSVREGRYAVIGLRDGERVETGGVPLVADTACPERSADFMRFLMSEEEAYVLSLKRVLRDELGARAMIYCTQASYGGLAGLRREARLGDVIDMHCYPCHPHEAADGQGGRLRTVRNASMAGAAFGALEGAALWRVAGKPFLMTEFDLNPPNDHASENFPLLALLAAYQGWAGFAEYSWYNFQGGKQGHSRIQSHYATTGHAGQMCMVPAMALLFRQGLVAPAREPLTLDVPEKEIAARLVDNVWRGVSSVLEQGQGNVSDVWRRKAACRLTASGTAALSGASGLDGRSIVSDTGEIEFDRRAENAVSLRVNAPAARLLIGRVGGRTFQLGDVCVEVVAGTRNGYANIALVALDARPVAESQRLLLIAVARVENAGQCWNETRTGVTEWGEGPTLAEPVPLTVTLPGTGWRASALDGGGRRRAQVPMNCGSLKTVAAHATLWYLIERGG